MPPPPAIPDPEIAVLTLAPHARADVPAACAGLCALVGARGAGLVVCDVARVAADLPTVELLARLKLTAQRLGCRLALRDASPALDALLQLCGLRDALPGERRQRLGRVGALGRDERQPEEREHPLGVEERVQTGDAPV